MKIAITGAQSTGKTTVLNALKNWYMFVDSDPITFVDEITRKIKEKGFGINEQGDNMTQVYIMNSHLEAILKKDDIVVMDRCALDGVVYTRWMYNNNMVDEWVMDYAEKVFQHLIEKYDKIFYIVPEFEIQDDGVRSTDLQFRNDIVDLFNQYIVECDIPVIKLTGSVAERLEQLVEVVNNE